MRLDFHILWIDDLPDLVAPKQPKIRRGLSEHGFNLRVTPAQSVAEATALLGDGVFSDDIDLILVDYKLGSGPNGDTALREIRRLLKYREMIFYSAESARVLRDLAHKQEVEGIYCSHRDDLEEVTLGVFLTIVRRVLDIDHCRGIVLGATSDVDAVIIDCIQIIFNGLAADKKQAMLDYARSRTADHIKSMEKYAAQVADAADIGTIMAKHMIFTSVDRLKLLRNELKALTEHKAAVDGLQAYSDGPMKKRDELAHKRIVLNGFARRLVDRDGAEITLDEMKDLRKELLGHRAMVEELAIKLKPAAT